MASRNARQTPAGTPGRRANITGNQYFDIGRVGRKTGITLEDTGVRDEHGLEPMSEIFSNFGSSPASEDDGSAEMEGLNSTMPDVEETIHSRKLSRAQFARTPPSRLTGIFDSSPRSTSERRQSQSQPQYSSPDAYRELDLGTNGLRQSIEKYSPFKPRHVLRRSSLGPRKESRQSMRYQDSAHKESRQSARYEESIGKEKRLSGRYEELAHKENRQSAGFEGLAHKESRQFARYAESPSSQNRQSTRLEDTSLSGAARHSPTLGHTIHDSPLFMRQDETPLFENPVNNEGHTLDQQDRSLHYSTRDEIEGALDLAESMLHNSSPSSSRKRRRTEEGASRLSGNQGGYTPPPAEMRRTEGQKRPRLSSSHKDETIGELASDVAPTSRRRVEEATAYGEQPVNYEDQIDEVPAYDEQPIDYDDHTEAYPTYDEQPVNEYGDHDADDYDDDVSVDVPQAASDNPEESPPAAREKKGKASTARSTSRKVRIEAPQRRRHRYGSSDDESDSASDSGRSHRGTRSNVRYRSGTPMEDAGQRTTRSGRAVMKPLEWWSGESFIWDKGEVTGVKRATSVEPERRTNKKRAVHKKKTNKIKEGLDAIDEQDEDCLPSDWEQEVGIVTGDVATYDHALELGDVNNIITEDLAFAASTIITRSVHGATFSYAKISTLPFFGSGVVELPPEGVKTTKNSKKMQMNFFVHKGKVQVTITTPLMVAQEEPVSSCVFSITEGGAFVVPRGHNYAIANPSATATALLFFSQGCEVEHEEDEEGE
ncbi:hypothetical protein AMS68_007980 [Peltaster fructicola]|uniref:Mif2/CENP-C cupin domain-containing protein n=1 Tax=Peltaster fructicola TaxID=286661 RepID=A0A6H0Y635_9PEZI|nr:hypothetical protein AMS68_007980 [Peltaster fructicola]